nr:hypothetical protein MFLOJ_19530 [Mycobacterium florentinum]
MWRGPGPCDYHTRQYDAPDEPHDPDKPYAAYESHDLDEPHDLDECRDSDDSDDSNESDDSDESDQPGGFGQSRVTTSCSPGREWPRAVVSSHARMSLLCSPSRGARVR